MNQFKFIALIFLILISSVNTYAQSNQEPSQEEETLSLNSGSIDNQFEFIIRRSNRYQDYKVVKTNWLYTLKSHVIDSLKAVHDELDSTNLVVSEQQKEINDLKANLSTTQTSLDATNKEKDSMTLFGMQMSKSGYNMLMWVIIAGLLALLVFFIYKFKNSNSVTKQAKNALAEIEEEFEEHRKVALEREQKVRRQLQDEINKQKTSN
ncbi:tRNA (guanine-N1)-methyltransferase [Yeosuana sp. MJ-SS3]|uniref:tRNA (Guanine-N1)-methyltransferase n=1 Tax=Gilvirhabdus luticola TaxID=3079858 RepID=A0ABU3UA92_9FLAO|nr:tRNA (guanine-N1)-methyltransferase [Yeosuana sp. MJ-SS3]MDU8887333.1 tRNA (guanine-N1)-methyltransferase [Yeosuana sp. MJ-SS3]